MPVALRTMTISGLAFLLGASMATQIDWANGLSAIPQLNAVLGAFVLTAVIAILYRGILDVFSPRHLSWREKVLNSLVMFGMAFCAGSVLLILPLGYYDFGKPYDPTYVQCAVIASIVGAIALWLELVELQVARLNDIDPSRLYFRALPIVASVMVPALSIPALAAIIALNNTNSWKSVADYRELIGLSEEVSRHADALEDLENVPSIDRDLSKLVVSLQASALEFDRRMVEAVARHSFLVAQQDERSLNLRVGQIGDRIRVAMRTLSVQGIGDSAGERAGIANASVALQPLLRDATEMLNALLQMHTKHEIAGQEMRTFLAPLLAFCFVLGAVWPTLRLLAAQRKLAAEQARLVVFSQLAVARTNHNGAVVWMNQAFLDLCGYGAGEALRMPLASIFESGQSGPDALAIVAEAYRTQKSATAKLLSQTKDGRPYWVALEIHPIAGHSARPIEFAVLAKDITDLMDARLKELDARARSLAQDKLLNAMSDLANVGGWEVDLATMTPLWSPQTRQIHEVDDEYNPDLKTAIEFYAPEARKPISDAIDESIASGQPWDLELPFHTAKGRTIWVRAVGKPIVESGRTVKLIGAIQDVTDQRIVRVALTEALEKADTALADLSAYQTALDEHSIVAITDAAGTIIFANNRFCNISGYARDELIGQNHRILKSEETPPGVFAEMWKTITSGQTWNGEIANRRKDGAPYWVNGTIVPMPGADGTPVRYVSVQYDISSRKRADSERDKALAELSQFFNIALDLLCIADADGHFLRVNKAFETTLGYRVEGLVGTSFWELIHPRDIRATFEAVEELRAGKDVINFVNRYRHIDGRFLDIEWHARATNGLIYAAARDVTERLLRAAEDDQKRIEAESATRAKSQFLANMSHEIRTPLNGVIGLTGALARTQLTAQQREMVQLAQNAGETLERLLSDILDLSKIEAGKIQLEVMDFDIVETIKTAAHLMATRADDKGIGFQITFNDAATGMFRGDALRIRQVVSNLVSNAVKFTQAGKISVSVNVFDPDQTDKPSLLSIRVEDTGVGFDESVAEKIFDQFEQVDASPTRSNGGTGLGLAICRAICNAMGGAITATSRLGHGSKFTACFPIHRSVAAVSEGALLFGGTHAGPVLEFDASHKGPLTILLAEDNALNQRLMVLMLEPFGVELTIANDGEEAIDKFKSGSFDLVLMDMQMPRMDGLAATRAIRFYQSQNGFEPTPIAMLSANALREHVEKAAEAGAIHYITKPVTPESLIAGIQKALSLGAQTRREHSVSAA